MFKCFYFSHGEKRNTEHKPQKFMFSWLFSLSSGSNRKLGSDMSSQPMSQAISEPSFEQSHDSPDPKLLQSYSQRPNTLRVFSYEELKTATRNFYRGNLLGEGGFGCVFKGWIRQQDFSGQEMKVEVAVKQLNRKGQQGHKEWLTEVHFLGLAEHPNLVKLIGYCAEDDERGIQRLLVYEFLPNKSLEEHLFRRGPPVLQWNERLIIALGAAQGLTYLHEELPDLQVIFRDFKTSNVLLDNTFNAKLSDFGLARQGPQIGVSHVSTAVVGTIGYAAPEYIQTGHLTVKSDVWSFGVVLLEILTGRRSLDRNRPKNEQKLVHWAKPYLHDSKKFHMIMDPRLEGQYVLIQAQKVGSLAQQCLGRHAKTRPKMSHVVKKLKQIVEMPSQSVMGSPPMLERSLKSPNKESIKGSSSKRNTLLFKEVLDLRNKEDARAMLSSWVPNLVRT